MCGRQIEMCGRVEGVRLRKGRGKFSWKLGRGSSGSVEEVPTFLKANETYFRFGLEPLEIMFYFAKYDSTIDFWIEVGWFEILMNGKRCYFILFQHVWICFFFLWFSTLYHGIHHRFTAIWGMCFYLFNHLKANLSVFLESSTSSSQVMTKRPRHWRRAGQLWPEEPYLCQCLPGSSWKNVFFSKRKPRIFVLHYGSLMEFSILE